MEPTWEIEEKMYNNTEKFKGDFFDRFSLRHNKAPLKLTDSIEKNYLFPTFYGDVTCAVGIFLCDYEKAKKVMLHPKIEPVKMPKGRALVIFSCYEYQSVYNIAPYNEVAMTIPVMFNPGLNIPVLPIVMPQLFNNFGYYVFSMPVTSKENQLRGTKIWGLPKVTERIDIDVKDNHSHTRAYDEKGEIYFELSVPTDGKKTHFDVSSPLYTKKNGHHLQSYTNFQGDFFVNKNMSLLFDGSPDRSFEGSPLKLGNSPRANLLKELDIIPTPFQFRYCYNMSSCFDLPSEGFKPSI
ncbi:MAG: hypothetical protein HOE90_23525 [Bacteriovoracaceae bacterium]|nr:hypothetical protein [Bacteriovoracaceae bacterium]